MEKPTLPPLLCRSPAAPERHSGQLLERVPRSRAITASPFSARGTALGPARSGAGRRGPGYVRLGLCPAVEVSIELAVCFSFLLPLFHKTCTRPFLSEQLRGVQDIHCAGQPPALSGSRTFLSPQKETPSPWAVPPHPCLQRPATTNPLSVCGFA